MMIGDIIQKKRKERGLTQAQLAEKLGITAPAVNRWEKNLSYPDATLLAPLARCLNTDLNALFSFYDSLSDKERELIVKKVSLMFLEKKESEAFAYIDETVRQNLSDGLLYHQLGDLLFIYYNFAKSIDPAIYLSKAAMYYECALELLPEKSEEILCSMISVYSYLGDNQKAEEALANLPDKKYDKAQLHAEMMLTQKQYDAAVIEIKEIVLRRIIELSLMLGQLTDALTLNDNKVLATVAKEKNEKLISLFDLWIGFRAVIDLASSSKISMSEDTDGLIQNLLTQSPSLSNCVLFDNVVLGNNTKSEGSAVDTMADLLRAIDSLN